MTLHQIKGADEGKLYAAVDSESGHIVFPIDDLDTRDMKLIELNGRGELWSFTVQRFRPKSPPYAGPEEFTPFVVGYVKLDGQLMLESRIVNVAPDAVEIGMQLELTWVPLDPDRADSAMVHAFQPLEG
jgi:uncharacterized OB-fold protein